ncbi:hypothetical protein [Flavobacterium sp. UBA6135]|uniref:hypothetical protein n=1 Tax=Flavobacterium sp. UBA6135 TaxID=1946553 RepID=UPI0025B91EF2|nr:hypothetical protein [Flavobacterium sp. UBA6135]
MKEYFLKSTCKPLQYPKTLVQNCQGLFFQNKKVKTLLFSTDMAIIENIEADAVLAVYPFSPSERIMKSIISFSNKPVICGVGGGLTKGKKSLDMAMAAEQMGAAAVIVNQPFLNKDIETIKRNISIPVISSVSTAEFSFQNRINSGVDIFHITGGQNTNQIIQKIKHISPLFPIIATSGKTRESVKSSVQSGVNAIVLTPPTNGELFKSIMNQYRNGK